MNLGGFRLNTDMLKESADFIKNCYTELNKSEKEINERLEEIKRKIISKGIYTHTFEELEYGARVAWRNSNRCIGRLFWEQLHVKDQRCAETEEEIFHALFDHIAFATNNGKIRPTISIFPPRTQNREIRILNHQLIRYAGYETSEGIIGDPHSVAFTKQCMELGWEPKYGRFDLLPLVVQISGKEPVFAEIPNELILEVEITHPQYESFRDLNLKWYGVPIISEMRLEIGGVHYTAAPFNGWYMGTEIGARNLADEFRYNMLPKVASLLELDTKSNASLWKDRAIVELNAAVLHSYKEKGVTIVDHHTAAHQFRIFEEAERNKTREVTGDWTWLIPPVSPAATHIFHHEYENKQVKPNYFYQ